MAPHGDHVDDDHAAGLSIGEVSDLLAVPAPTLRSWERRYGLPTGSRSPGGHRRYLPADIIRLRYMRDEIAAGRLASDAARRSRTRLDATHPAASVITALLEATESSDAVAIREALDRARADLGMAAVIDDVVMPAMRQVGAMWETGRCDVGQAQFTSEAVRGWLAAHDTAAPPPATDQWVLLTVGPRDLHTLGMEALASLLRDQQVACRVLGPRTPVSLIVNATRATAPDAVVVVSHLTTQRRSAVDALRAVAQTGTPIFYAGNAFIVPSSRRDAPGTYLGESIAAAADQIRAHLRA